MSRIYGLVGVPSSAGAHYPGQEKTPATLRSAGLEARLSQAGIAVDDHGNLPSVCCRVDPRTTIAERIADVQIVAGQVANCVEKIVSARQNPLVIGGDCTITIGVVAQMPVSMWVVLKSRKIGYGIHRKHGASNK
jgi:arginase